MTMSDVSQASVKQNGDYLTIRIPTTFKRRAGRKEIILPQGYGRAENGVARNRAMVLAIARAHRWQRLFEEGDYRSLSDLARKEGLDVSYLCRSLRLALLAPDIIAAIVVGREPSGLSVEMLMRAPADWNAQRQRLGFTQFAMK